VSTRTPSQPDVSIGLDSGLSIVFRSLPDACALITWPEGRIVAVNEGLARLADYEAHEVVGRLTTEVLWPDAADRARFFGPLGPRPSFREREVMLRAKDGGLRTVLISGETIDVQGAPHLFVIARDVSEERRVAAGLRRSEERYRTFLALSGDAMAHFELDEPLLVSAPLDEQVRHLLNHSYVRECNDAYAQQYGRRSAPDLVGRSLSEFRGRRSPDAMRVFAENRYRILDREVLLEVPGIPKRWVRVSATGIVEEGRLVRFWVTQRDVTKRKRAEDALMRLAAGVSSETGEAFFQSLAGALCEALNADRAFVGVLDATRTRVETIAACAHGQPTANFGYPLRGAPCEGVVAQGLCYYPSGVQATFPDDDALRRLGIEGYAGCPIEEAPGRPAGLLVALFEKPIPEPETAAAILRVFAVRCSAELQRSRAEEALRASEKKYRDIVDLAPLGFFRNLPQGRFLMVNESFARILGYDSVEEVLQLSGPDIFVDHEHRQRLIAQYDALGRAVELEVNTKKKDGSSLWVHLNVQAIKDVDGRSLYYEGFILDISERKRAEQEQRRLNEALGHAAAEWQRTFDAVESSLLVFDENGRLLRLNRAAGLLLGPSPGEAIASSAEEPWQTARDVVRTVRASGAATSAQAHDAARRRTWDLSAVRSQAGEGDASRIILAIADISGIVELQEMIRRNETLSAMGALVAGVAHEVRNPLFSISATLDALHAELGDESRYAEYWPLLRAQVGRLKQLTSDLLDYGKPQRLRLQPTNLKDVLHRSVRACSLLARQGEVGLEEETAAGLPAVPLDSGRLEQVFENLIANAIQHSPRTGAVRVRATPASCDGRPEIHCSVSDEGPGIAEQDLPHVFEPFFSKRKGGTGLGLAIVQRIVGDHGGRVLATNRAEGGAVFTVCLPLTTPEVARG
jgi:PAS domain S-box-containing protein